MLKAKMMIGFASVAMSIALAGCSVFKDSSGTPSNNTVAISHGLSQSQLVANAMDDVTEDKTMIDALVGNGGYDHLASGSKDAWSLFDRDVGLKNLPEAIQRDLPKNGLNPSDVSKIKADCDNLKALYNIASKNRNQTGANALKLYHRVCEDINYYFTNAGEEFGVSHVQGGYQTTEQFINQHK